MTEPAVGGPATQGSGDPAVDAVLERLDGLDEADLDAHVAVFEQVHRGLADILRPDSATEPDTDQ